MGNCMGRIRRTPEAARAHIISAARRLLIDEGPRALKLQRVGKEAGMSHASVIHYFGSIEGLTLAVVTDNHRKRREKLRDDLGQIDSGKGRRARIEQTLATLADPEEGRLTVSLLSLGLDPFPPEEELGLASISNLISTINGLPPQHAQKLVLAHVLVMLGEAMVGQHMRARLGVEDTEEERAEFRRWFLEQLA